jgi:hypothetical protein
MSTFREKAQGRIGDDEPVQEGKEQEQKAERPAKSSDDRSERVSQHLRAV